MAQITTAFPKSRTSAVAAPMNAAASAIHKPSKTGRRPAKSMHIRRADNGGFSATTHYEAPTPSKQQMKSGMWPHDQSMDTVHPSIASLKRHISQHFGDGGLTNDAGLEGPDVGDAAQQENRPGE